MVKDFEEVARPYVGLADNIEKNQIYRSAIIGVFLIAVAGFCGKTSFHIPKDEESCTNAELSWQRTGFHFEPEKNYWMSDPAGPFVYKGWYHLFYQYNPGSRKGGNITWGHAVSKDLVHWLYLDLAMVPDHWYDINGVWTGSATLMANGTLVMLYTGSTNESVQVQNLAFPENASDPLLQKWVKSEANPVLVPPKGIGLTDFRDPSTGWIGEDGAWRITIGSTVEKTGVALIFKTEDFVKYEQEDILHSFDDTGMWECVDFYPVATFGVLGLDTSARGVGVKHVLKASFDDDKHDYYTIGTYDTTSNKFISDNTELNLGVRMRYDYGKYYASKSFYDREKKRRIMWGWVAETNGEQDDHRKGWASLQTIPRHIWFDNQTKTNIIQWPIEEINKLRTVELVVENVLLHPVSVMEVHTTDATQLDIQLIIEFPEDATTIEAVEAEVYNCSTSKGAADRGVLGPFGLLVIAEKNLREQTAVYFYIAKSADGKLQTFFCHDESRSSLATDLILGVHGTSVPVLANERTISVRTLVDHSIVESYAQGGRRCITSRVYPTEAVDGAAKLFLFNNGSTAVKVQSLNVWQMESVFLRPYRQIEDEHWVD